MLKVLAFLTKKEGMDTREFIDHYESHHVPLICRLAPVPLAYKRNFLVHGHELNKESGSMGFDVVTELTFPDRDAYVAWVAQIFKPGSSEQARADEENFLDRSRTRLYVVEEYVTRGQ